MHVYQIYKKLNLLIENKLPAKKVIIVERFCQKSNPYIHAISNVSEF